MTMMIFFSSFNTATSALKSQPCFEVINRTAHIFQFMWESTSSYYLFQALSLRRLSYCRRFYQKVCLKTVTSKGHRSSHSLEHLLPGHPTVSKTVKTPQLHRLFSLSVSRTRALKVDGNVIAQEIKDEIKAEVDCLIRAGKRPPHLAVLLVGSDPASVIYVKNKAKAAKYTGILCDVLRLPSTVTEQDVLHEIYFLNKLSDVDGILVQLPLPSHINERVICDAVLPEKDVDGFNVLNVGRFCVNQPAFIPATPSGVLEIIKRLKIETFGKNAVVCGRSKNVGMPIAMYLHSNTVNKGKMGDATTTICHRNTPSDQLKLFTRTADIIVTATGIPNLLTANMVRDGVVIIDIGISRIVDGSGKTRLVGDVDFEGIAEKASYITPVPGGVGPVTVAMLMKNTLIAYNQEFDFGNRADSSSPRIV